MAGRKAGEPRKDRTRNAKARGVPPGAIVPAVKPGPVPWTPSPAQREQIKSLAGRGVPQRMIATLIGVNVEALTAGARDAIDEGVAVGVATLTGTLFAEAKKGSIGHLKLYLAHVAGIKEGSTVEHSGPGGGPVGITILTGVPQPESGET